MDKDKPRTISTIASDIRFHWKKPWYGAELYIEAMESITSIDEMFYFQPAREIVALFLSNARYWRGEKAKEIKLELKAMLNEQ